MNLSIKGKNMENIINNILYGMCGFFFAIFAVRYGVRSTAKIKKVFYEEGVSAHFFLACLPAFIFMLVAVVLFPILLYTRTPVGGFVYLATYIFFNMKVNQRR